MQFFLVYIREAHAMDSPSPNMNGPLVEDPITDFERHTVAQQCVADLDLPLPTLIDKIDDKVNQAYGALPDRLYLVGRDGKIAYAGARGPFGFKPDELEGAIKKELEKTEPKQPKRRIYF